MRALWPIITALLASSLQARSQWSHTNMVANRSVIVQLFEWRFDDIAEECESFLGPLGYGAVQTPPVTEHGIILAPFHRPWFERYQPVSYIIQSRSGNEDALRDMVRRCNNAGVRVYVEVVLNHMTGKLDMNRGLSSSEFDYDNMNYPGVPYNASHFHTREQCGTATGRVEDFLDVYQMQTCEVLGRRDLDQSHEFVREKMAQFLNILTDLGVAGFYINGAGNMRPDDLKDIFGRLKHLRSDHFPAGSLPFIYLQVVRYHPRKGVQPRQYNSLGKVTEYSYSSFVGACLQYMERHQPRHLIQLSERGDLSQIENAVVFIQDHLTQRRATPFSHLSVSFFKPKLLQAATAFMLGWPHGLPRVISSYQWARRVTEKGDYSANTGPPAHKRGDIRRVIRMLNGTCGRGWICEHRWPLIPKLVEFRRVVGSAPLKHWWTDGHNIAFARDKAGFVFFSFTNRRQSSTVQTGMQPGIYCDIVTGRRVTGDCTGDPVVVERDGRTTVGISIDRERPVIAIHRESRLSDLDKKKRDIG